MNASDKPSTPETNRHTPAEPISDLSLCLAETNRLNAETIKLVAEANAARARQLRDLEQICLRLTREPMEPGGPSSADSAAWLAQLWPVALRGEPWRDWRERLLTRAANEGAAALLLARLHTCAALEKASRPWPLELVRDLGRSVYEAAGDTAERLAQVLTQVAAGRFEIRVVRVGDRVDNKFMKPAASGVVEVRTVSGWAVRDATGQWQFPADVS